MVKRNASPSEVAPLAPISGDPSVRSGAASTPAAVQATEETPFEFVASICSVLVVGLFILTFLGQNFVIPSGSMEKTLLVGDHLLVDRITLSPGSKWMPLVHYREPRRGDITVFIKPVPDTDTTGNSDYLILVKRLIGVPGDHIRLRSGVVYINGVAQTDPPGAERVTSASYEPFLDEFPTLAPPVDRGATDSWSVEFPSHVVDGELVVPPGHYFMMGDHRHNSLDSRFWGFVPRENIIGRPLFNYWSFNASDDEMEQTGVGHTVAWMGHVALHIFDKTRWNRTLRRVR